MSSLRAKRSNPAAPRLPAEALAKAGLRRIRLYRTHGALSWIASSLTLLAMTLLLAPLPAHAALEKLGGSDAPIEITADSLEVLQPQHTATFKGNVKAIQGEVTLTANTMVVHYREGGDGDIGGAVAKIEAVGDVLLATPQETARGAKGIYNVDEKKVYLLEDVVLTRDKNVLKGTRLEYSFATGRSIITGGAAGTTAGGRVKAVFVPEKKQEGKQP